MLDRTILGIDPGLAHTGWGLVHQSGSRLSCVAYGCTTTSSSLSLADRLLKIHNQIAAVISRYIPQCAAVETVWFGQNITAAEATSQARGAALVACAAAGIPVSEFTPNQIKLSVVGEGHAEKEQVQYMVRQLLSLEEPPHPDHAADALAAAICCSTHEKFSHSTVVGRSSFALRCARAQDDGGRGCARAQDDGDTMQSVFSHSKMAKGTK